MNPRHVHSMLRRAGGVVVAGMLLLLAAPATAMRDPAAVYCTALGYQYFTGHTAKGDIGVCRLPNGRDVNASDFYGGRLALEWSFCARQGYGARRDESGSICGGCTVCLLPDGTEIWVTELMGLSFRESTCGDRHCGTAEDHATCPEDCRSGGLDALCDGVADGRCDRDCVDLGGADPDCPGLFVDVMPPSCPNPLHVKARDVTTIAILGTIDLPASSIDPATVRVSRKGGRGSVAPLGWRLEDVATPYSGSGCGCGRRVGDRRTDLVLELDSRALVKTLGLRTLGGRTLPLRVRAKLVDGTRRSGGDCVQMEPARRRGCLGNCRLARAACVSNAAADVRDCRASARRTLQQTLDRCGGDAACRRAAREAARGAQRACQSAAGAARASCRGDGRVCGACCGANPAGPCVATTTTTRPPLLSGAARGRP